MDKGEGAGTALQHLLAMSLGLELQADAADIGAQRTSARASTLVSQDSRKLPNLSKAVIIRIVLITIVL